MSKPFVCTGCRIRLAIRPRASSGRDIQHRDFSQSATENQTDPQARPFGHIADQRDDVRRRRIYEEGIAEIGRGRTDLPPARKYYGQPLKPQHLLQELDETQRPAQGRQPQIYKRVHREANEQSILSRPIGALITKFRGHVLKSELLPAWNTLLELRTIWLDTGRIHITKHPDTMKRLHQMMRRIVGEFVRNLGATDANQLSTSPPSPWEFVQVARDLNLAYPALRAELLWRLGNALVMKMRHDSELSQEQRNMAFHQLALVWHDTLQVNIQTGSKWQHYKPGDASMQWSFLPSPESITKSPSGSHLRLDEVLLTLLPTDKFCMILESQSDYQSALLVTLDLLKGSAFDAGPNSSGSSMQNQSWKPLANFFEEILLQVVKSDVPPAIRMRLTQAEDPTLSYYEAMVRRFDLANIPPIRTERSKATKDVRRNIQKQAALNQKADNQAKEPTGPSEEPDVRVTKIGLSEEAVPAMGSAPALDKDSLLRAGFSVSELFSMDPDIHRRVLKWTKTLGRSIETSNLLRAEKSWEEVRRYNAEQAGSSSLPLFLYEHFMLAFLALRQPRLAVQTWNAVLEAGLKPTVKSWTVMMRGCALANDADTMEKFWTRMIDQGVQPDAHAWSVRLFGLIKAGRINKAFSALQDMGQEWVKAVRAQQRSAISEASKGRALSKLPDIDLTQWNHDVNGVPRPNLAILNSVVSSLANKSDEHISRALSWGRSFAIELDLTTFNALLNVAMRHGQTEKAFSILQHMKTRAIEPNSTTITVVLTALFQSDFFTHLSPEEQTEKLFAMVEIIESSSPTAKLDVKGYALAIDRMLGQHDNPAAARALLEHMSARGLQPTTHIYTILISSYFAADPPDFAAAEALWSRLQGENSDYGVALDTIFYDRMVEGYARHHAHVGIAPMMQFLERMSIEGKRPGWRMLELVARALVDRDEWGILHRLVDDIRYSKGMVRVGVRGLVGQNEFWRYILDTGVLSRDGITSEQQMRKNVGGSTFNGLSDIRES